MPASIYKSLNFGDLESTRMTIQLANRRRDIREVKAEVNSASKTSVEVGLSVHARAEVDSVSEDRKQAKAESILNNQSGIYPGQYESATIAKGRGHVGQLVPKLNQVGQSDLKLTNDTSSSPPPPIEMKPLLSHLKYAYLDIEQQLPVIIANNLHRE
ncbi:hypothetical protein CR513_30131, partial [Mucuna pruriens]